MALLSKQQIHDADASLPFEDVPVPQWGGEVRIVGLSGKEVTAFQTSRQKTGPDGKPFIDQTNIMADLVSRTMRDANNELVYTVAEIEQLGAKSGMALTNLFNVAQRLSGLIEQKELEKN